MKKIFTMAHATARQLAADFCFVAPEGWVVTFSEPTRTLDQNAMLWPLLEAIAKQIPWHGVSLTAEEYKDLLSAGLVKSKVVPNIDGNGFVILGQRTSKMNKKDFADLLELVLAFGAEHGVVWSEERMAA